MGLLLFIKIVIETASLKSNAIAIPVWIWTAWKWPMSIFIAH